MIRLKDLTAQDIQTFYDEQLERVKANTVIHYHAIIKLALCYARKMGYIKENPIEQVEKPEKNKFVRTYYTSDEVNQLISLTKGTKLEIAVIFACFYGLRRSECIGLKWSAFDFENNIFHINYTVVLTSVNGKRTLVTKDTAKTDATIRTMPLSSDIKKRLFEIKCMQDGNKKRLNACFLLRIVEGNIIAATDRMLAQWLVRLIRHCRCIEFKLVKPDRERSVFLKKGRNK